METTEPQKNILKKRAQTLSQMVEIPKQAEESLEVLEFSLANELYAIETCYIREVYPLEAITRVPCTPPFVLGVINLRGQLVSIIDLGKFFNLPERGITHRNKMILVHNATMEFGIFAKSIGNIKKVALSQIQNFPTLQGIGADYVKGVTSEGLVVLQIENILNNKNTIIDEKI